MTPEEKAAHCRAATQKERERERRKAEGKGKKPAARSRSETRASSATIEMLRNTRYGHDEAIEARESEIARIFKLAIRDTGDNEADEAKAACRRIVATARAWRAVFWTSRPFAGFITKS